MDLSHLPRDVICEIYNKPVTLPDLVDRLEAYRPTPEDPNKHYIRAFRLLRECTQHIAITKDTPSDMRLEDIPYEFLEIFPNLETIARNYRVVLSSWEEYNALMRNKKLRSLTIDIGKIPSNPAFLATNFIRFYGTNLERLEIILPKHSSLTLWSDGEVEAINPRLNFISSFLSLLLMQYSERLTDYDTLKLTNSVMDILLKFPNLTKITFSQAESNISDLLTRSKITDLGIDRPNVDEFLKEHLEGNTYPNIKVLRVNSAENRDYKSYFPNLERVEVF